MEYMRADFNIHHNTKVQQSPCGCFKTIMTISWTKSGRPCRAIDYILGISAPPFRKKYDGETIFPHLFSNVIIISTKTGLTSPIYLGAKEFKRTQFYWCIEHDPYKSNAYDIFSDWDLEDVVDGLPAWEWKNNANNIKPYMAAMSGDLDRIRKV